MLLPIAKARGIRSDNSMTKICRELFVLRGISETCSLMWKSFRKWDFPGSGRNRLSWTICLRIPTFDKETKL